MTRTASSRLPSRWRPSNASGGTTSGRRSRDTGDARGERFHRARTASKGYVSGSRGEGSSRRTRRRGTTRSAVERERCDRRWYERVCRRTRPRMFRRVGVAGPSTGEPARRAGVAGCGVGAGVRPRHPPGVADQPSTRGSGLLVDPEVGVGVIILCSAAGPRPSRHHSTPITRQHAPSVPILHPRFMSSLMERGSQVSNRR